MKALVVFDTNYGNTKAFAETLADSLGKSAKAVDVDDFRNEDLKGIELLIAGCPVIAWNTTTGFRRWMKGLNHSYIKNIPAAVFDTRINSRLSGNASKKIARSLAKKGMKIISEPKYFYVVDKEGPPVIGEMERARLWGEWLAVHKE